MVDFFCLFFGFDVWIVDDVLEVILCEFVEV